MGVCVSRWNQTIRLRANQTDCGNSRGLQITPMRKRTLSERKSPTVGHFEFYTEMSPSGARMSYSPTYYKESPLSDPVGPPVLERM